MNRKYALFVLGLGTNATADEIRSCSIELLMKHHPDRHPEVAGNEALQKLLSEQSNLVKEAHDFLLKERSSGQDDNGHPASGGTESPDISRGPAQPMRPQAKHGSPWAEVAFGAALLTGGAGCLVGIALGPVSGAVGGTTIGLLFFAVKAASRSRGGIGLGLFVGLVVAVAAFAVVYNAAYDSIGGGRFDSINAMHEHDLVRRRAAIFAAAIVSIVIGTLAFAITKGLAGRRQASDELGLKSTDQNRVGVNYRLREQRGREHQRVPDPNSGATSRVPSSSGACLTWVTIPAIVCTVVLVAYGIQGRLPHATRELSRTPCGNSQDRFGTVGRDEDQHNYEVALAGVKGGRKVQQVAGRQKAGRKV